MNKLEMGIKSIISDLKDSRRRNSEEIDDNNFELDNLPNDIYNVSEMLEFNVRNGELLGKNSKIDYVVNRLETLLALNERKDVTEELTDDEYSKIKRGTKVQVRDYKDAMWRNAYFMEYKSEGLPNKKEYKFLTSNTNDEFINETKQLLCWKFCRLYKGDL